MGTYEIPRNVKGEGRLLFIFSTKGIIYTAVGLGVGLPFYLVLKMFGATVVGIVITVICALIGFSIGTFKVPEIRSIEFTKKTGGEAIDDVIKRYIKFKKNKNKIYVYKGDMKND